MDLAEGRECLQTRLKRATRNVMFRISLAGGSSTSGARAGRKCRDQMNILLQDTVVREGVCNRVCNCGIHSPKVSFGVGHQHLPKLFSPIMAKVFKVSLGLGRERTDQGLANFVLGNSTSDLDATVQNSILQGNVNMIWTLEELD
jgi:hypothetical protein